MTDAPLDLLRDFSRTLFRKGEWLRRLSVIGYVQGEGNAVVERMAGLASDMLGFPVAWARLADCSAAKPMQTSIVVGIAETAEQLRRAVTLSHEGHRVIVAVPIPALGDLFEFIIGAAASPRDPLSPFSHLNFAATVSEYPTKTDHVLVSHMKVDARMQQTVMNAVPLVRSITVMNAAYLESVGRSALEPVEAWSPRGDGISIFPPLSDSSAARNIGTAREN